MKKILYVASVSSHIDSFHTPYIDALRSEGYEVSVMANGEGVDFNVPFRKRLFDKENKRARKLIKKIVMREGFDAILLNTSLAAFHTRLALGKRRPRVVNIVHGYLFPLKPSGGLKARLKRRLLLLAERLVSKKTDSIIVMNGEDVKIAKKYRLTDGEIRLCRGMGVKARQPSDTRETLRDSLGMTDKFVILFAGELSARKNQAYLIRLLPRIIGEIPNAELWLLGEGGEKERLRELAAELGVSERVRLLGQRSDVIDYMAACDAYASASISEGLPFNIIEALSVGAYTVCSSVKGHEDALNGGGESFCLSDTEHAAELIIRAKDFTPPLGEAIEAARRFCFDSVFDETYRLIKECIE